MGFCKILWIVHRAFEFPRLNVIGNVDSPWSDLGTGYVSFLSPTPRQPHFYSIEKTLTLVTPLEGILNTLWTRSRNWKQNKVGEKPNETDNILYLLPFIAMRTSGWTHPSCRICPRPESSWRSSVMMSYTELEAVIRAVFRYGSFWEESNEV